MRSKTESRPKLEFYINHQILEHLSLWMGFSLNPEDSGQGALFPPVCPRLTSWDGPPSKHACTPAITHTHTPMRACTLSLSHTHTPVSLWARRWDTARAPSFWDLRFRIWALGPSRPCFPSVPTSLFPGICFAQPLLPGRHQPRALSHRSRTGEQGHHILPKGLWHRSVDPKPRAFHWVRLWETLEMCTGNEVAALRTWLLISSKAAKLFLQSDRW